MSFLYKPGTGGTIAGTAVDPLSPGGVLIDPTFELTQPGGPYPPDYVITTNGFGAWVIGPSPGAANSRVFRWDIATPWSSIYSQILARGGTGIVMVEPDILPRVITTGTANLDNVVFIGEPISPDASVVVDLNEGVVLGPGGGLRSKNIFWRPLSTGTKLIGTGQACSFDFDGGGMIGWADPSSLNPIRLDLLGNKIRLINGAMLSGFGTPVGEPLIIVSAGGSLDIQSLARSSLDEKTVSGGALAAVSLSFDASSTFDPAWFSGLIVTTLVPLDSAARVTYDDTLVPPLLAADDVQEAIDALKTAGSTGGGALIRPYTAGVVVRSVVYQKTDGTVDRADASAVSTGIPVGLVEAMDVPAIGMCVVRFAGDLGGFVGLVTGSIYLLSTAPGGIVEETDVGNINYPDVTPGSGNVIAEVGIAGSATTLFVGTIRDFEEQ